MKQQEQTVLNIDESTKKEEKEKTVNDLNLPFKVILFNDDWHSFDEVIIQLIKALRCSLAKAKFFTFEAHIKGSAIVFTGELGKCLEISSILEEIDLKTKIVSG